MQHYICTGGCEGESSSPGLCQAEECKHEGEKLTPCDCTDGLHAKLLHPEIEVDEDQK